MSHNTLMGVPIREATFIIILKTVIFLLISGVMSVLCTILILLIPNQLETIRNILLVGADVSQTILQVFFLTSIFLMWVNSYYKIDGKWLIRRQGIFSTEEQVYDLSHMNSVSIKKSLLGKFFHYGTVSLSPNAICGYGDEIWLVNIYQPERIEEYVQQHMSKNLGLDNYSNVEEIFSENPLAKSSFESNNDLNSYAFKSVI